MVRATENKLLKIQTQVRGPPAMRPTWRSLPSFISRDVTLWNQIFTSVSVETLLPFHRYIAPSTHTLGKPKDSFKVFCKIIRESTKELFGQLNNYIWIWGPRFRNPAPPCTQVRAIARFYLALGLEREGGRGPEGG